MSWGCLEHMVLAVRVQKAPPPILLAQPSPHTAGSEEDKWASGQGPGDPVWSSTHSLGQEMVEFVAAEPCGGEGDRAKGAGEVRGFHMIASLSHRHHALPCTIELLLKKKNHFVNELT